MRLRFRQLAVVLLVCAAALVAQDWRAATSLPAVDFTGLSPAKTASALKLLRDNDCTCGCGMKLAQCVATDMTCPVRSSNITKIRAMVQKALNSGGGS